MREVLFKAKRIDNGEWIEGNLVLSNDAEEDFRAIIIPQTDSNMFTNHEGFKEVSCDLGFENWYKVDKNTICQFTGLTDKNEKRIWENDVLKGFEYPYLHDGKYNYFAEVVWFENCPAFGLYTRKNPKAIVRGVSEGNTEFMEGWNPREWEVIGNIFDNPELLKE